jgi:hypothetical protein
MNSIERHECEGHDDAHVHGPDCGHERVRHGDRWDYVVGDHLHHVETAGCASHGSARRAR